MIIGVTKSSFTALFIIFSFIVSTAIMYVKANTSNEELLSWIQFDFEFLGGEINFDTDNFKRLHWMIYITSTVLLPIILVNFLIAKMSSKYTDMEENE